MGLTKVTTKLTSLVDPKRSFESLFLVDTGATDSMAPSDELEKLGIKQEGKMAYELADGTVREYPFGLVRIEFMGETTAGRVIFAAPGVEPILGVPRWSQSGSWLIQRTRRSSVSRPFRLNKCGLPTGVVPFGVLL